MKNHKLLNVMKFKNNFCCRLNIKFFEFSGCASNLHAFYDAKQVQE